jgi:cytochrome P450
MTGVLLSLVALAAAGLLYLLLFVGHRDKRLPPGPPTLPIIGNLHQIPKKGSYLKFTEWAQTYGGFYSLKLGPATAVVLTDRRLVKELLDKKSGKYSNRPYSHVSTELMTKGDHVLIMQYGDLWRKCRKLIHQSFMETKCDAAHIPTQNAEALQMMRDFALHPEQHMLHPKRYSNSIIMSLLFGIRTPDVHTPHMEKLYAMMENWSQLMEPGNTPPVDIFPFLHWVPESWLGSWVSRSKNVGDEMSALYSGMLELVQARRAEGINMKCFTDVVLDQNEKTGLSQHELYFLVGTMMEGGSDTTSSIVIAWVQAMTRWGEVLRKAQTEIDGLMGEERSPVWEDYERLPYVAQMVKEAMRWRPVVPTAFPHALAEGMYWFFCDGLWLYSLPSHFYSHTDTPLFQTTGSMGTSSPKAQS